MNSCTLYFPTVRKRLCFGSSHLMSIWTSSAAAEYAESSSDDCVSPVTCPYSELKHRMCEHAIAGSLSKAIETLNLMRRSVPDKLNVYDYNSMIGCYFKSKNVVIDELFQMYKWMKKFGPRPNLSTFSTMLHGLISVGQSKHAILVVKEMLASGFSPSSTDISKLCTNLLQAGNVDGAFLLLEMMLQLKLNRILGRIIVLVRDLCKVGYIEDAYAVFMSFSSQGHFCTTYVYNPILWALCKSQHSYAMAFFGLLRKKGLECSIYSYTALVYGFSNVGLWGDTKRCLREMESVGCKPGLVTYTVVVKSLCEEGRLEETLSVLGKMVKEGCGPDLVTLNIILRALYSQGRVDEADEVLEVMGQMGLSPDKYTIASFSGLLKIGKVEIANRLLFAIISRSCSIDDVVSNIFLHSMCSNGNLKEALITMQRMTEKGFRPSNATYNTVLKGLCQNNIEEALRFLDHAKWPSCDPDMISFNTMLSAACKRGDPRLIRKIVRRMEDKKVKFDVVSSTCLIQYYCSIGKFQECYKILESMLTEGPQPNEITLNTFLAGLCKNRRLEEAVELFQDFGSIGVSPNGSTYNILIRSSIKESNGTLLLKLSRDMRRRGVQPNASTYGCFIYSVCKEGKISLALRLRDRIRENGISPNIFMYNTIMHAMLAKGMFWEVFKLFKDMAMDDCEPNNGSLVILRQAMGQWRWAHPRAVKILELVVDSDLFRELEAKEGRNELVMKSETMKCLMSESSIYDPLRR